VLYGFDAVEDDFQAHQGCKWRKGPLEFNALLGAAYTPCEVAEKADSRAACLYLLWGEPSFPCFASRGRW